jgi:hypothetical protein
MDRASLANTASAASTPSVTIAVMSGKRQKSHSIVPADTVNMAKNATVPIRADADALILTPPSNATLRCDAVYLCSSGTPIQETP